MRGSGQSGGQFTTLGVKESSDVHLMIKTLQNIYGCKYMILYGRSMGAASILKFVNEFKKGSANFRSGLAQSGRDRAGFAVLYH